MTEPSPPAAAAAPPSAPPPPGTPGTEHGVRDVLRIPAFRKLWTALSLSSFGDWLGLLALTALAPRLADGGYAAANLAIAGVFILRLLPAILIGPIAGVIADRLDRRWTMVVCDVLRFALFLSIPVVGTLWWLLVATFLIEAASLVWIPAKEATVPNLVPRDRLEGANQLSLLTTYGSAPVAAAVFAGLALLSGILDNALSSIDEVDLALFFNASTFLVSALTILRLTEIPARVQHAGTHPPSVWRTLVDGWRFVGQSRLVRGLVVGMLGATAAGGAVVGLARIFITDLKAGDPGYGLLFGTVFLGLAAGMFFGPRLVPDFSRRRLFGLAIASAGTALVVLALVPNMVIAVLVTLVIGAFTGVAWVTGYTLLGLEVADDVRGRTFAFVQTMVRVVLVLTLALAPLLAAAFGQHELEVTEAMSLTYNGAAITFLLAGLLAAGLGVASLRQMDDRRGVPLFADLTSAYRNEPVGVRQSGPRGGYLIALEGGEGAGKSTQARLLAEWLQAQGHTVLVTFEPGGTELGRRLRGVLLDHADPDTGAAHPALSPRAEALLFAADRAEHVASVILPALDRGEVVVTDRYLDSSVAYQGAGRDLAATEVARLSRWATDGLTPDLTVLLDLAPAEGLARVTEPDRLESEPLDFHTRVRERFLGLAHRGGSRYLVVDATKTPESIADQVRERLLPVLPMNALQLADLEERRRAEAEEDRRAAEAAAAERAAREQAEATARAEAAAARAAAEEQRRTAAEQARVQAREEKERKRAAEVEERERRRAAAEAERAAASAERARRAMEDAELRRQQAERRAGHGEVGGRPRQGEGGGRSGRGDPDATTVSAPVAGDPPTQRLSLADELFGDDDETIHLPRVDGRDDR